MSEETIVSEVIAASLGGAISASILYPLEVLKCKMQAVNDDDDDVDDDEDHSNVANKSMIPFALKVYKNEGAAVFLRGVETSAFQSALEKALYFFAYTALKDAHSFATGGAKLGSAMNLALGCAAEWAHLPITLPVDAWTTKIQTSKDGTAPMKILLNMLGDRHCNFYKGLSAYYLLCFKPALQYTIYEQVKTAVLLGRKRNNTSEGSLSSAEAFLLGMVARTVATVLVFPFLRAKVLLQTSKSSSETYDGSSKEQQKEQTTWNVLLQQWNRAGVSGLYQGIGPELTRGIFSAALMLMIKERIAAIVRRFFDSKQQQLRR